MIYRVAVASAEAGKDVFLRTMAMISINLGLLNLLPIPVLDGFHILSAGFETVRRLTRLRLRLVFRQARAEGQGVSMWSR